MSAQLQIWSHDEFPTCSGDSEVDLVDFPVRRSIVSGYFWRAKLFWDIFNTVTGKTFTVKVYADGGDPDPYTILDSDAVDPQYEEDQVGLLLVDLFWSPNQDADHDRDTYMRLVAYMHWLWGDGASTLQMNNIQGRVVQNVVSNSGDVVDWRGVTNIRITGQWSASGATANLDDFYLEEGVSRIVPVPS